MMTGGTPMTKPKPGMVYQGHSHWIVNLRWEVPTKIPNLVYNLQVGSDIARKCLYSLAYGLKVLTLC